MRTTEGERIVVDYKIVPKELVINMTIKSLYKMFKINKPIKED
jgi:hypothetical protein